MGYHAVMGGPDVPDWVIDQMAMVLTSTTPPDSTIARFYGRRTPVMAWKGRFFEVLGMGAHVPAPSPQREVSIVGAAHPLSAGLNGQVSVLAPSWPGVAFPGVAPGPGAVWVATAQNDPTHPTIFAYPKGATLANGTPAAGPRVGFFASGNAFSGLSSDGWRLFDASVDWLASQNAGCVAPCQVTFKVVGTDADGDALTYTWAGCAVGQTGTTATCPAATAGVVAASDTATDGHTGSTTVYVEAYATASASLGADAAPR
jgi:hypothetical protein